ncbi:MAG: RDD family protein [Bacteroidetes bacterium]|nr:MAG: RDD family protein [Bacteroidota bacterium]RLD73435.1 MAG: RDD family protein [Bacteroidota bacterium]
MAQININTSQNVLIVHPAASIGKRMLAQLLDFAILFFYYLALALLFGVFNVNSYSLGLVLSLPAIFYSFLMELFFQGQSIGKMALQTRVVKIDGSQPTIINYFTRWIIRLIDIPFYGSVAIITIAVNGKGQRLGDIAAGTTVINLKKNTHFNNSIYKNLPSDYQLQFQETEKLTEKDIKIINEVLNHHQQNRNRSTIDMLIKTKEVVMKKIGIITELPPLEFLKTVIKDYNYIIIVLTHKD